MLAGAFQACERSSLQNARAAALEEKIVELAAADAVADGFAVVGDPFAAAHDADANTVDGLEDAGARIFGRIDVEFLKDGRRDPSATDLVAREKLFIEDDRGQPGIPQLPGARAAGGPGAGDQDIARVHCASSTSWGVSR